MLCTLVMVNEQRSGYDGSASAEAPSSPSGASKLSSVSWRSAMEKIRRMLSHRGEKKNQLSRNSASTVFLFYFLFLKKKTARDGRNVLLISKLALEGDLVIARNVFDLPRNKFKIRRPRLSNVLLRLQRKGEKKGIPSRYRRS